MQIYLCRGDLLVIYGLSLSFYTEVILNAKCCSVVLFIDGNPVEKLVILFQICLCGGPLIFCIF